MERRDSLPLHLPVGLRGENLQPAWHSWQQRRGRGALLGASARGAAQGRSFCQVPLSRAGDQSSPSTSAASPYGRPTSLDSAPRGALLSSDLTPSFAADEHRLDPLQSRLAADSGQASATSAPGPRPGVGPADGGELDSPRSAWEPTRALASRDFWLRTCPTEGRPACGGWWMRGASILLQGMLPAMT